MRAFSMISPAELDDYVRALRDDGWREDDFELDEEVYDPATAEVEACLGHVAIKCRRTEVVAVYSMGGGSNWIAEFIDDLRLGKFGSPPGGTA